MDSTLRNDPNLNISSKPNNSRQSSGKLCRIGGFVFAALLVAGCTQEAGRDPTIFRISVTSDEPAATLAGRDALAQGGSAVDAAVAMAMTMAVTLPSRAGLGGGGACLVHDPATGVVRALDFLPRGSAGSAGAGRPLMIRGLFALHAEYGKLRWESDVIGAENAARFGFPVSRALAADIAAAPAEVLAGASMTDPSGRPLREGEMLEQPQLAELIAQIRSGGAAIFHGGELARRYAAGASAAGLPLTVTAVREARPRWIDPVVVPFGRDKLYFLPEPGAPGLEQALIWQVAADFVDYEDLTADNRLHLLLEAERRAAVATGVAADDSGVRLLMADYSPDRALSGRGIFTPGQSAHLVALSNDRMAVACTLTMNGAFGSGRIAGDTGVIIARPPASGEPLVAGLTMLVNEPKMQFLYGGAADSTAALMLPMMEILLGESAVGPAMSAPRAEVRSVDGAVIVETAAPDDTVAALRQRGQPVRRVPEIGRAAVIFCLWDRASSSYCSAAADPRGDGLAYSVER